MYSVILWLQRDSCRATLLLPKSKRKYDSPRLSLFKEQHLLKGMKEIVEDIATLYDNGFQGINSIFDTYYQILEGFQDSFLDLKQEREKINAQLRENLAKNDSLRKKDFDQMMQGILSIQDEKETEIRNLVNSYISEQKEMLNLLRDILTKIKEALAKGEAVCVKESQGLMNRLLSQQDKRKEEVTLKLKEFQKEQQEITKRLLELLSKGRELRIKDLKSMLREFEAQHNERLVQQEERRKEAQERKQNVQRMLSEFKKKRMKQAAKPPEAINIEAKVVAQESNPIPK